MGERNKKSKKPKPTVEARRDFLLNSFMGTGLVVSHMTAAGLILKYLYPVKRDTTQKLFVGLKSEMPPGTAIVYEAPGGQTINVVRGNKGFIALSDVCPHLGCRVHFESQTNEFYCPCHAGRFDGDGNPVSGPPAEMGASLPTFPVEIEGDMVFLKMSVA